MMTSALAQLKAITRVAFYLLIAFLAVRLWQDPSGSADATANFVGSIGTFFSDAIDKISVFIQSLGN
jgi:hypothetical protein